MADDNNIAFHACKITIWLQTMKKFLIPILVCFLGLGAQALSFYPSSLGIQNRENSPCYLAILASNGLYLTKLLAFSQSHLAYIDKIIEDAGARHKYVAINLDKIATHYYKLPFSDMVYNIKFIPAKSNIKNLIYISDND